MAKPRTVHQLLHSGSALRELRHCLSAQEKLLTLTRSLLPAPLDQHCLSAQQRCSHLIIHTGSSAWASRLRYFSRDLRAKLRSKGVVVQKIEVRVFISNPSTKRPARHIHRLSQDNAELIEATADEIQDANLRAALKRLSQHRTV
ncbi:MAG: DUF721 domain-containing protein [Candidatus Polarisedimenticolaceae bacterium]|nr:DUF721 domain-containing protein [Candidatus Polarisedimenticolaceae bacterium]